MNTTEKCNIIRPAIRVEQPLGTFYAFSLRADILNQITYSLPAEIRGRLDLEQADSKGGYSIFGSQRVEKKTRLQEIASFIQTTDATFPNAIILAANYSKEGLYVEEASQQWRVEDRGEGFWSLSIPQGAFSQASIIDGQHRLHAFEHLPDDAPQREMELLCVVFLELPTPFHAYVFATINFNQKKVDRGLAYELFGFDVDERPVSLWSPETLAVYLTRLLNTDAASPFYESVFSTADTKELLATKKDARGSVSVSIATVVDGILRLISKNPQEDRNTVRKADNTNLGRKALVGYADLPLRTLYLEGNDKGIYEIVFNFFHAVSNTIWQHTGEGSYLRKTVGVQAFFDVLRILTVKRPISAESFSIESLSKLLEKSAGMDSNGDKYQASGIGRSEIRRELIDTLGL
ncbi:DNA phosphorothioation-associated DGQHR protein 1 [Pseudomonas sp. GV047]|uniref:DNA phosphorothioation-associated DGQHR protein 1 n=1 Tax=Pseudomonas sp. GV047 TaxID=2135751 RepID=UPI000D3D24A0|nr:DNA phosphorothioation-associated DGQHR protein 1 [Pseudomonas sp. GV047]PUB42702.1 DNA phosphorothioation-associated DGQHR protein 1 [Pseudomonas sp. GV047]